MVENKNVGELLKTCRLRAGKTQEEMAKHLYVDRSTISRWENDEIPAPYAVVRQWCAFTQGIDLMTMDLSGGVEGWKKLQKLEDMMRTMQNALKLADMYRKSNEGQAKRDVGIGSSGARSLFGRVRS